MPEFAELINEKYVCPFLMEKVRAYFEDKEHEKAFEKWYKDKYGEDYEQQKAR